MKRILAVLVLVALLLGLGMGAGLRHTLSTPVVEGDLTFVDGWDGVITDLSSATTLTVPDGARIVLVQAQTGTVRYRLGSTAPTASAGGIIDPNGYLELNAALSTAQFIQESDADLYYAFFK